MDGRLTPLLPAFTLLKAGLPIAGVPATLVSAADSEYLDELKRLNTELDMLSCVLSVDEGSRLSAGVLERMGVAGLTARGKREPELRDLSGKPAVSGLGLATGIAEGPRESG